MGSISYVNKEQAEAKDKLIARLYEWFSEKQPEPFELADFQSICIDAGLMNDDDYRLTLLGNAVFGQPMPWQIT